MTHNPHLRSCFVFLQEHLQEDLRDEELVADFNRAGTDIRDAYALSGCIPVSQDSLAGFLKGFALACSQHASAVQLEADTGMLSATGGIYLLALAAPLSCAVLARDAIYRQGFWDRYDVEAGDPGRRIRAAAGGEEVVRLICDSMPDVPVTTESLAGLVLGLMYSRRFVPVDEFALDGIVLAARGLALSLRP